MYNHFKIILKVSLIRNVFAYPLLFYRPLINKYEAKLYATQGASNLRPVYMYS